MKKHIHSITINKIGRKFTKLVYNYGSTKNIELVLSKEGFSITAYLTKVVADINVLIVDSDLFRDGIRKALLLYLMTYSKGLKIVSITTTIDEEMIIESIGNDTQPPIYSMISNELVHSVPDSFLTKSLVDKLLNMPKSQYDKRIASLFSFLCSKSKEFESERFIYLWTTFNGMYSWVSDYIAKSNNVVKYRRENKQLQGFLQYLEVGKDTIDEDNRSRLAHNVITILNEVDVNTADSAFFKSGEIDSRIQNLLRNSKGEAYNLTAYGYMLTQLSYYYRCKIVHGSKPIFLFAYADDRDLHGLQIINNLLEEFITEHLPLFFDDKYVNNVLVPKTQKIELK